LVYAYHSDHITVLVDHHGALLVESGALVHLQ
jgi:hypothetical protein